MKRDPSKLARQSFDLIVIGGGSYGCCAAWEGASRGLSVALIEKEDFCHATSANHLKMVHGGIRYLQHLDIPRVRESLRERAALLRIAPHLVQPIPIIMPTYGHGLEGRFVLSAGLKLYDVIAADRNRGISDPTRQIPGGRLLSRSEILRLYPEIDHEALTGAGLFYDGQFYNPQRLALAFLQAAIDAGAEAGNYVEATEFMHDNGRVRGVIAKDNLSGEELAIRGRTVLNTAGPWAPALLRKTIESIPKPMFSRDTGLLIKGSLTGDHALACRVETSDPDALLSRHGRHVFMVPWRGYTLLGVWHKVHDGSADEISVEHEEIQSWLDEVNRAYPAFELGLDDVAMVYAGLILFGENQPGAKDLRFGKRSLLFDHGREDNLEGLWTLIGVRATTARGMAQRAINQILAKLDRNTQSRTDKIRLPGGEIDDFDDFLTSVLRRHGSRYGAKTLTALAHNYGSHINKILELADRESELADPIADSHILKAEVSHAVRTEMAIKLQDVVFRRTELGTAGNPGHEALRECATLMGSEMHWNQAQIEAELDDVLAKFSC